jgi:hypothetical protein
MLSPLDHFRMTRDFSVSRIQVPLSTHPTREGREDLRRIASKWVLKITILRAFYPAGYGLFPGGAYYPS